MVRPHRLRRGPPPLTPIPDLIAQWHAKTISGTALMRGLVSYDAWELPVSEAAAKVALAQNALPSVQLSTLSEGKTVLFVFSSPEAYNLYSRANSVTTAQHFVKLHGRTVFAMPTDRVDQVWVDCFSAHDIWYGQDHFGRLRDYVNALAVEEALTGLRHGSAADGAIALVRDHPTYFLPVADIEGARRLLLAPDEKGRRLGAVFTSDDTFDAFGPDGQAQARGAKIEQIQTDGRGLFGLLQGMQLDGFVFNCAGPIPPVAFAHAMATVVMEAS